MQNDLHPSFKGNFSIVLPVHNGAKYIRATLESILSQTYPHFNVLILENASQDNTLKILASFTDTRIKIFPAERLLSMEENWARIVGLDLSEYMTIVGHDDLM